MSLKETVNLYRIGFKRGTKNIPLSGGEARNPVFMLGRKHGIRGYNKRYLECLITGERTIYSFPQPNSKEIKHILKQHNLLPQPESNG